MRITCEFFNWSDEVCFIETEVKVKPLKSGLLSRPLAKELGIKMAEALVTLKSAVEFEWNIVISKYEYQLWHWYEHPEIYENKEEVKEAIDMEKDWRKHCCVDGIWSKWLVERLSEDQLKIYEEFKEMQTIEKIKNDENFLIKFLAARKFDIAEASKFLQERLDFMQEFNLDWQISPEEFPTCVEDNPVVLHKSDFYGRPVVYTLVYNIHPAWYTDEQLWNYTAWNSYKIETIYPKNVDNYIVIYDFKGAGLSNINYHHLKNIIANVGGVFPESVYKIMVLWAAWFVNMVYGAIKPILHKNT